VHALALANIGELASGFALIPWLPPNVKGIVTKLEIEYVKKGRGLLTSKGFAEIPTDFSESLEMSTRSEITDEARDVVSTVKVDWLISPKE
jgi:hypothetical protein